MAILYMFVTNQTVFDITILSVCSMKQEINTDIELITVVQRHHK